VTVALACIRCRSACHGDRLRVRALDVTDTAQRSSKAMLDVADSDDPPRGLQHPVA
jgi:hypothetical protein